MHLIDAAGHVNNQFVHEDPATNRPPTEVDAAWLNAVQNEIASVITGAGMQLEKSRGNQLLTALMLLHQPRHDGIGTLTGVDNKIILAGLVTALKLEKGDVIQLKGGGANEGRFHTVESITNDNTIVVNYEHCGSRGNGSLKLVDFTGAFTVTRVAKSFNAPPGIGQDWVNVLPFRALKTGYINSTGRPFQVSVTYQDVGAGMAHFLVGSEVVGSVSGPSEAAHTVAPVSSIVPAGSIYKANNDTESQTILRFVEQR